MDRFVGDDDERRIAIGDRLGAEDLALNRYRLPPGEGLPSGLHAHLDQEEVFLVLEGTVTFETLAAPVTVDAGDAVRFAPGEYQSGANEGDTTAVVLAVGAPTGSEAVRVPLTCPDCEHRGLSPDWDDGEVLLGCPECGAEHRTRGCPDCERSEMRVASGGSEGETVVTCPDCGAERSAPRWA